MTKNSDDKDSNTIGDIVVVLSFVLAFFIVLTIIEIKYKGELLDKLCQRQDYDFCSEVKQGKIKFIYKINPD